MTITAGRPFLCFSAEDESSRAPTTRNGCGTDIETDGSFICSITTVRLLGATHFGRHWRYNAEQTQRCPPGAESVLREIY